ncbi:SMI1/KNR4 family protein [Cupriavidus pauculus]|uniref:SMI1/KNR4 family protein n=1 Tax=Cupriavidus pauculus TaxID=82633 RepID=A0A5P2HCC1_9BURK|nr:SMI1/KNR4 family protein [Cupriavidus pauculus]QET05025.1 SMI1/KNR4 family protein [Cupriavidus pauculus]
MISETRTWFKAEGATTEAIAALRSASPIGVPERYYELLAFSNGGEGPLPVQPHNFCLDTAEMAAASARDGSHQEFFAKFFVFGGNGAGELIAFDTRADAPWPIVAIDMTNINLEESVMLVASEFEEFVAMIGLETGN